MGWQKVSRTPVPPTSRGAAPPGERATAERKATALRAQPQKARRPRPPPPVRRKILLRREERIDGPHSTKRAGGDRGPRNSSYPAGDCGPTTPWWLPA